MLAFSLVSDRAFHYLLVSSGLGMGSFAKAMWDELAERFWDTEWQEFRKWKSHKGDSRE